MGKSLLEFEGGRSPGSIKKSNLTSTQSTQVNQALQDEAIGVSAAGDVSLTVQQVDAGLVEAARDLGGDAIDGALDFGRSALDTVTQGGEQSFGFARDALDLVRSTVDRAASSTGDAIKAALNTANIRSQVPSEVIASDGGATVRVAIIAAAAILAALILFRGAS